MVTLEFELRFGPPGLNVKIMEQGLFENGLSLAVVCPEVRGM